MNQTKSESSRLMWVYTLISLVIMLFLLAVKPEWFWVALPFFGTYLVKAFGVI
ncbi:MAG TPA: hypothetical protein PKM27_14210 [Saprospiraceae bacterium]|nr:hypothetical protein [Saprospiraceae bacterium]HNT21967.1 hypothetical protein [Saprospiraceae bacterium]